MLKGLQADLPAAASRQDGAIYYCTDTRNAFLGKGAHKALDFFLSGVGYRYVKSDGTICGEIFNDYTNNVASGTNSLASGGYTTASGNHAVAEGYHTVADDSYSHTAGYYTLSTGDYSFVIGKFNDASKNYLFAVGNGTADNTRSNAFTINSSGDVMIKATLDVNTVSAINIDTTEFYLMYNDDATVSLAPDSNGNPILTLGTDSVSGSLIVKGTNSVSGKTTTESLEVSGETSLKGTFKINNNGKTTIVNSASTADTTISFPAESSGTLIVNTTANAIGSSSYPVYINEKNEVAACAQFANGTQVKLNNVSKKATTASFYAPTSGGAANYYLVGNGTTAEPVWTDKVIIQVLNADPTTLTKGQIWINTSIT